MAKYATHYLAMPFFLIESGVRVPGESDDMDLFIQARNKRQALQLWRKHYELDRSCRPDRVWLIKGKPAVMEPYALQWHKNVVEV